MSKYMTVAGITFKKIDLKRIERITGTGKAYITVAGMRTTIFIFETETSLMSKRIKSILLEAEEK